MMKFTTKIEYKLKGERNISARKPLVAKGRVFVIFIYNKKGFTESRLQCLDSKTLELKWEYIHNHVLNNLILSDSEKLICSCMDGVVKCFDPITGELIWSFRTKESNIGAVSNISNNSIIFSGVQARSKSTWCLDINRGDIIWQINNDGHAYVPLILDNQGVFCIGKNIYSVSMSDGSLKWKGNEPDTYLFNPKKINDLIMVGGHGKINFYNFLNGKLKLSIETGINSAIREPLTDGANNLYFGDEDGNFYCFKLENVKKLIGKNRLIAKKEWSFKAKGGIQGSYAIKGDSIYFLSDGKELISLNRINGDLNWEFNTKGEAGISGVTIDNEEIYIACGNGYVYKLKE